MSTEAESNPLEKFNDGEDRYINFAEDVLQTSLTSVQQQILREVTLNRQTVVCSGNGVGKSYSVAVLILAFLYCNKNGSVLLTSGSYAQMEQTVWPEVKKLLNDARENGFPLPGTPKEAQPRIEFENHPTKSFQTISSKHPDSLEGRHAESMLVIVDEADKQAVDSAVLESARSSVTDDNDRFLVIGNPPREESNSMWEVLTDPNFRTVNFTSFESRNVQIDAGLKEGEKLPGLVDLSQVKADWQNWHRGKEFPGVEACMEMVERDDATGVLEPTIDDLDERWYRRRLGCIPAEGSQSVRPFHVEDVSSAMNRWDGINADYEPDYDAYGVDIARGGGDRTVIVGITPSRVDILANVESPGDHAVNKRLVEEHVEDTTTPVIVDAIGEGSGIADELSREYNVTRFKASEKAIERQKYYDKRSEALGKLGQWLDDGAVDPSTELATELRAGARHIEFEEKTTRSSQSWTATSKDELKQSDSLGRSPDLLDAASLAAWGMMVEQATSNAGFGFYSY
jgi:hypothetical protein